MAANLSPQGLHPDAVAFIKQALKDPQISARDRKVTEMMLTEPQIKPAELEKIGAPALILAASNLAKRAPKAVSGARSLPIGAL